jgi:glycosyltransferase involved in cell wall biosynthesis
VSDGSTDGASKVTEAFGAKIIQFEQTQDANACRNRGAEEALGDILVFLDSDVVVKPKTFQCIAQAFADEDVDAIVGVYSTDHRHPELASQYKNLWIRYSYLIRKPEIDWIFGAISAIRRDVFWKMGAFDAARSSKRGGEDLEFGKRLARSQCRVVLKPDAEVEHLKRHTLQSLLRNDFDRSGGFFRLALHQGEVTQSLVHGFANVYPSFIISTLISIPFFVSAFFSPFFSIAAQCAISLLLLYGALNMPFLIYFAKRKGIGKALQAIGIMLLDHLACASGVLYGLVEWLRPR